MDAERRDRKLAQLDYLAQEAESAARRNPRPDTIELAERVALTRAMVWRSSVPDPPAPPTGDPDDIVNPR